jgi:GNAT superfamily N-acetyltransferase
MGVNVRKMTDADVGAAAKVQIAAFAALSLQEGHEPRPITDDVWARIHARHRHFLTHDPAGSWVATDGDQLIGCALALRREGLWGLSLLVVDPEVQSKGTGRALLDASLTYAEGCERAVILSTTDPRAMRSYATSGFDLFPQVEGSGEPDPASLPALHGRVRDGSLADVDFAESIDRAVRGAARGPDQIRLATDMAMFVIDDVDGRGYAYFRSDGIVFALAATDDETADALLWRCLVHAVELGASVSIDHMNAQQQWAIRTAYKARLNVKPGGPVLWRGGTPPPSYLPSGMFL